MEYVSHAPADAKPALWRGLHRVLRLIKTARARHRRRRDAQILARLPDHLLRDIGREDLIRLSAEPHDRAMHSHHWSA